MPEEVVRKISQESNTDVSCLVMQLKKLWSTLKEPHRLPEEHFCIFVPAQLLFLSFFPEM